jgi:hypothetical protein
MVNQNSHSEVLAKVDLPEVKAERPTPAIRRVAFHANASLDSMMVTD